MTLEECANCKNFTIRNAIEKIFDGVFEVYVVIPGLPSAEDCKAYSIILSI